MMIAHMKTAIVTDVPATEDELEQKENEKDRRETADASTNVGRPSILSASMTEESEASFVIEDTLEARAIADRLRYQRWPNLKIFRHVVRRNHPVLSALTYNPFSTRAQRFAVLEASLMGIITLSSLFF